MKRNKEFGLLRFAFLKQFNILEHTSGWLCRQFEKDISCDPILLEGYQMYTHDFKEMIYDHIEKITNEDT